MSPSDIGLVEALFPLAGFLSAFLWGALADYLLCRKWIVLSLKFLAAVNLCLLALPSISSRGVDAILPVVVGLGSLSPGL
jgi:nitrate/nitrite transporter NarK